jgi:DNA-binding ferritin-like protein
MVDLPSLIRSSGLKLAGITPKDEAQFNSILSDIDQYAQQLVTNFEATTHQIHERLNGSGGVALQALSALSASRDELDKIIDGSFEELQQIVAAIESVGKEFNGLNLIQNELVLLSDLLTAVEEAVKRPC